MVLRNAHKHRAPTHCFNSTISWSNINLQLFQQNISGTGHCLLENPSDPNSSGNAGKEFQLSQQVMINRSRHSTLTLPLGFVYSSDRMPPVGQTGIATRHSPATCNVAAAAAIAAAAIPHQLCHTSPPQHHPPLPPWGWMMHRWRREAVRGRGRGIRREQR